MLQVQKRKLTHKNWLKKLQASLNFFLFFKLGCKEPLKKLGGFFVLLKIILHLYHKRLLYSDTKNNLRLCYSFLKIIEGLSFRAKISIKRLFNHRKLNQSIINFKINY